VVSSFGAEFFPTELFKQYSDNPAFKKWLAETIFSVTYTPPAA